MSFVKDHAALAPSAASGQRVSCQCRPSAAIHPFQPEPGASKGWTCALSTCVFLQATSALDAQSEAQVQAALDRAMKQTSRSCLVIAHRCALALVVSLCDDLISPGARP